MADNGVANPGTGGLLFRLFQDLGAVDWPAAVVSYVAGGGTGAWSLQHVELAHPLPIQLRNSGGTEIGTAANPVQVTPQGGPSGNSLSAATATGAGTAVDLGGARSKVSMQVDLAGTAPATAAVINLEGQIAGSTSWKVLAVFSLAGGNVTGDIVASTQTPVTKARANLVSFSGGTAPTFTANLAAVS
jgi:hypothetical protein